MFWHSTNKWVVHETSYMSYLSYIPTVYIKRGTPQIGVLAWYSLPVATDRNFQKLIGNLPLNSSTKPLTQPIYPERRLSLSTCYLLQYSSTVYMGHTSNWCACMILIACCNWSERDRYACIILLFACLHLLKNGFQKCRNRF